MFSAFTPNRPLGGFRMFERKYVDYASNPLIILDNRITTVAKKISSEMSEFKTILQSATSQYQKEIQNKYFRNTGRARAEKFQQELKDAKQDSDVLKAYETAISAGNQNEDSLKTFIFLEMTKKYWPHDVHNLKSTLSTYYSGITYFLEKISKELHNLYDMRQAPEPAAARPAVGLAKSIN